MTAAAGNHACIVKPTRPKGGRGVYLASITDGRSEIRLGESLASTVGFRLESTSVVEQFVKQHPHLNAFATSGNSARIETLLKKDGRVPPLGALVRFGVGVAVVDNQSGGGSLVGVSLGTGQLYQFAMDGRGRRYAKQPDSDVSFRGFEAPLWRQIRELAEVIQRYFPYTGCSARHRNHAEGAGRHRDQCDTEPWGGEMDFGPTFTSRVAWSAFREYDLLLNEPSGKLY